MVEMVKDPVCGMTINKNKAVERLEYKGQTYYFCSVACHQKFRDNPEQYVADSKCCG